MSKILKKKPWKIDELNFDAFSEMGNCDVKKILAQIRNS